MNDCLNALSGLLLVLSNSFQECQNLMVLYNHCLGVLLQDDSQRVLFAAEAGSDSLRLERKTLRTALALGSLEYPKVSATLSIRYYLGLTLVPGTCLGVVLEDRDSEGVF